MNHASVLPPRRRDVLALGTCLAITPAVTWAGSASRKRRNDLAIGFCTGSVTEEEAVPVVPADSLTTGDPSLADGVRLTIHGLQGDANLLPSLGLRSAELKVGFSVDGGEQIEFLSWSYQLQPVKQSGSALSFDLPPEGELNLALEAESFGKQRFEAVLSTGSDPGVPKLRTGDYLIAPGTSDFRIRHFDPAKSSPMVALTVEPLT